MKREFTGTHWDECVADAARRATAALPFAESRLDEVRATDVQVVSFPQQWGSTACGFPGLGGQAFTTAQTMICVDPMGRAWVYHGARFAYVVERPNDAFWEAAGGQRLPGARDWERGEFAAKFNAEGSTAT